MKYDNLVPLATPSRAPVPGDERTRLAALIDRISGREPIHTEHEVDGVRHSTWRHDLPALDPPEFYRVDDRLIEIWDIPDVGPTVFVVQYTEVEGSRASLKVKLKEMIELGLNVDSLPSWEFDETREVVEIYAGYSSTDEARADGRRLLLGLTLRSRELRFATGWNLDMVLLVRGENWYTIRTHGDGRIDFWVDEVPLEAHTTYAAKAGDLAFEIKNDYFEGSAITPFASKIAAAFISREAASALLAQARQSLRVAMESVAKVDAVGGEATNVAELARMLHTDRANLYKLMPAGGTARRRR